MLWGVGQGEPCVCLEVIDTEVLGPHPLGQEHFVVIFFLKQNPNIDTDFLIQAH